MIAQYGRGAWRREWMLAAVAVMVAGMAATSMVAAPAAAAEVIDATSEDRILALDPEQISAAQVRDVLSRAPAPRIICLQGSLPLVTMQPFAEFLVAMGYP